jgi:hypothetical protein
MNFRIYLSEHDANWSRDHMSRRSQCLRRDVLTKHLKCEQPSMLLGGPWRFRISVVVISAFERSRMYQVLLIIGGVTTTIRIILTEAISLPTRFWYFTPISMRYECTVYYQTTLPYASVPSGTLSPYPWKQFDWNTS